MTTATTIKPGIYYDVPDREYRAWEAWSPSLVVSGLTSMLQLDYDRKHKREPSPAMIFGTAVHCSILEPDTFPLRYAVWTGGRKAGTAFQQFESANAGRVILSESQYAACLGARDAVRSHPTAGPILDNARIEVAVVWRDHETGLLCKGRIDILSIALADIKTTLCRVAQDRALKRTASDLFYDVRLAAYHAGLSAHLGVGNVPPVKILFVEQDPPHDVRVKAVTDEALAHGWDRWQEVLEKIAACERSGRWPGCDDGESDMEFYGPADAINITLDGQSIV